MNPTTRSNLTTRPNYPISSYLTSTKHLSNPLHYKINIGSHLGITIRWGCRRFAAGTARRAGPKIVYGGSPC
jgi:hypothetical protein